MRTPLTAGLAGTAAGALVLRLASDSGGYFPDTRLQAGALAFAALTVLLAIHPPRGALSGPTLLAVGSLAALTVWTGLSSYWSSTPDTALDDFQRNLLYLGLLGIGLLTANSGRYSRHLVWLVLGLAATILGVALAERLFGGARVDAYEMAAGYRLSGTLGYWNALGALGVIAVVVGAGLAADARSHFALRGAAAAVTVLAGTAAYLSFSRGAWLAFFVGIAVLLTLYPRRLSLLLSLAVCGVPLTIVLLRLGGYEALTGAPDLGAGRDAEGRAFATTLLLSAAGAAAVQAAIGSFRPHPEAAERLAWMGRRAAAAIAGIVVVAAGVLYVAQSGRAEGAAASRFESVDRFISTQWRDFMNPATFSETGSERLTSARGTRSDLFRVAIDGFEAHPLRGDGSGGFEVRFAHDRRVPETVRDAHSLYLETLGELGAVGALMLVGLLGSFVWAATGALRRPRAMGRGQAAAAAAGLSVWAAHSAVDWDWQMPALTGLALLLAAALMPTGTSRRRRTPDRTGQT